MKRYELAARADRDLKAIYTYGARNFGHERADTYVRDLHAKFALLAEHSRIGWDAAHLRRGYRRFEHRSHTIFYRVTDTGVRIMRILHRSMDPERHV